MVFNRLFRILSSLLLFALLFPAFVSAENTKSPAVLAVEKVGGVVLPMAGNGREVAFHLRGRDLLADEGLKTLKGLDEVISLNLRDTKITSSGLVHLKDLSSLRRLHLERTGIGDAGLAHLSGLQNLEYLNLYQTEITDKGLSQLSGLKNLRKIFLWNTKVSDAGVEKLQKALPKLSISRGLDLEKIAASTPKAEPPKPRTPLKWLPFGAAEKPPAKSIPGSFIRVNFVNQRKEAVKLVWIDYGGGKKHYAEIAAGAKRDQTTYSTAVWLITSLQDKPYGYFVTGNKPADAIIPNK